MTGPDSVDPDRADRAAAAQGYYGRWATVYDVVARYTPGVGSLRAELVRSISPPTAGMVLDMGCGTGANFPYLRERVGPRGTVVGVDFTPEVLDRAGRLVDRSEWENVHLVRGDARFPPIGRRPDAISASFVIGMLEDPATAVGRWCSMVGEGGRIGLMDAARSDRVYGPAVNLPFRALVLVSTPRSRRGRVVSDATALLDARVAAAHRHLRRRCTDVTERTGAFGIVRIVAGTVADDSAPDP